MDAVAPSPDKERDKTTLDRIRDMRNMSDKQVRDYLASDEFQKHGSNALKQNAQRVLKLTSGKGTQVTMEDRALLKQALSAMERAKHASDSEASEALVKAKSYGFDPDVSDANQDYGSEPAQTDGGDDEDENDDEEQPEGDEE